MSLAVIHSRALHALEAPEVVVEVHLANGLPSFTLVGLADTEVREARERVSSSNRSGRSRTWEGQLSGSRRNPVGPPFFFRLSNVDTEEEPSRVVTDQVVAVSQEQNIKWRGERIPFSPPCPSAARASFTSRASGTPNSRPSSRMTPRNVSKPYVRARRHGRKIPCRSLRFRRVERASFGARDRASDPEAFSPPCEAEPYRLRPTAPSRAK